MSERERVRDTHVVSSVRFSKKERKSRKCKLHRDLSRLEDAEPFMVRSLNMAAVAAKFAEKAVI